MRILFMMSEEHLVAEVVLRYKAMDKRKRIAKIRKLASQSISDARFIRETFPDLYSEAFQDAGVRRLLRS